MPAGSSASGPAKAILPELASTAPFSTVPSPGLSARMVASRALRQSFVGGL